MSKTKTKTKVGKLVQGALKVLEGKGHHAIMIAIVDGKLVVKRFAPGKELIDVHEVDPETHAIVIDRTHGIMMSDVNGIPVDRLDDILVDTSEQKEEQEVQDED